MYRKTAEQIKLGAQGDITTTMNVPSSMWLEIKRNMWHYRELLALGMQAKRGMPQMIERQNELEEGNARLQKKLSFLSGEIELLRQQQKID